MPDDPAFDREPGAGLAAELARRVSVSFRDFMELALYGPDGYYTRADARIGAEGDFMTAPEWSPALGACLGRLELRLAEALGGEPPRVVELGAGRGRLLAPLLEVAEAGLGRSLRAAIVERGPAQREAARVALAGRAVSFHASLDELPGEWLEKALVVANELFDALPFHRVRRGPEGLEEAYVRSGPRGLEEIWQPCRDPAVVAHVETWGFELEPGQTAEVGLEGPRLVERLARDFGSGLVAIVDYGYPGRLLHGPGAAATARAFHRGRLSPDLLARPGRQDITAHVDFTALAAAARAAGLTPLVFADQGSFLVGLGAHELEPELRSNLVRLVHPDGMGTTMKVLVLGRGVGPEVVAGIRNRLAAL